MNDNSQMLRIAIDENKWYTTQNERLNKVNDLKEAEQISREREEIERLRKALIQKDKEKQKIAEDMAKNNEAEIENMQIILKQRQKSEVIQKVQNNLAEEN